MSYDGILCSVVFVDQDSLTRLSALYLCLPELCEECDCDGTVLPALESFAKRWRLPKVNYLFYHYFYKAAVGDATWKCRLAENKRLGPVVLEAYAHSTLRNQYFAWLYEYKANHPNTALRTEYDVVQEEESISRADRLVAPTLFCGNLDLLEVSVPTSTTANDSEEARDDFKLLLMEHGEESEEYKAAVEHEQNIAKEIKQCIDEDRTRRDGNNEGSSRLAYYLSMSAKVQEDASQAVTEDMKSKNKRRRASKAGLRDFTKKRRKTKKGNNVIKGWSVEGKQYMFEMIGKISQDEQSSIRKKWEAMYHKLWVVARQVDDEVGDDEDDEAFEMDEAVLYAEL